MILVMVIAIAVIALCFLIHYEALRMTAGYLSRQSATARNGLFILSMAATAAHFIEIGVYALALLVTERYLALGTIGGRVTGSALDYFYLSITSYTSLGLGDIEPHGAIRLLVGVEAINGLVLIGWTVTFTYPAVRRACMTVKRK